MDSSFRQDQQQSTMAAPHRREDAYPEDDKTAAEITVTSPVGEDEEDGRPPSPSSSDGKAQPPWHWRFVAVVLITLISFGSAWSAGITSPLKATLKKELHIDNTSYALLTSTDSFIKSLLILLTGFVTDRIGGANTLMYGNALYSLGALLVAAAAQIRSFHFMIGATVILSLGDCSTQVAQYQVFSSWFAPSNGFASTLGLELMFFKLGSLAGSGTANVISTNLGNFAWVYWIAFFVNLFTNVCCGVLYWLTRKIDERYGDVIDPATGRRLEKKAKKIEFGKVWELPWAFWAIVGYGLFTTSTISIFNSNATEFAQQRLNISAVTAGWYTSLAKDAGFILVPILGIVIDIIGNRLTFLFITGAGVFTAMALVNWASTIPGTAAAFGIFAITSVFSPMNIIDSIRTTLPDQTAFGTAYAIKVLIANSMDTIIGIVAGVIQDASDNSYDRVIILYMALAICSLIMTLVLAALSFLTTDVAILQWTRKIRFSRKDIITERIRAFYNEDFAKNRLVSRICFSMTLVLMVGGWAAYIWGAITGNE